MAIDSQVCFACEGFFLGFGTIKLAVASLLCTYSLDLYDVYLLPLFVGVA